MFEKKLSSYGLPDIETSIPMNKVKPLKGGINYVSICCR